MMSVEERNQLAGKLMEWKSKELNAIEAEAIHCGNTNDLKKIVEIQNAIYTILEALDELND